MEPEFAHAHECALFFRRLGLTVLPSRMDRKAPAFSEYAHFYGTDDAPPVPVPTLRFEPEHWRTTNLQIITGARHAGWMRVVVVDLDGEQAQDTWADLCEHHDHREQNIWIVESGSGSGLHLYYTLPPGMAECQSGMLWGVWNTWRKTVNRKGEVKYGPGWEKHKEIRLFADRTQIVAPPSIHPDTKQPYRFREGCGPGDVPMPAAAPQWLLDMPRLASPDTQPKPARVAPPLLPRTASSGLRYTREQAIAAIPDKIALAESWGLKFASRKANPAGWVSCYDVAGEERPSFMMHERDGTYMDMRTRQGISILNLGAILQPAFMGDWRNVRDWCGDRFCR